MPTRRAKLTRPTQLLVKTTAEPASSPMREARKRPPGIQSAAQTWEACMLMGAQMRCTRPDRAQKRKGGERIRTEVEQGGRQPCHVQGFHRRLFFSAGFQKRGQGPRAAPRESHVSVPHVGELAAALWRATERPPQQQPQGPLRAGFAERQSLRELERNALRVGEKIF